MSRVEDGEASRVIRVPKTHSVGMVWALRARSPWIDKHPTLGLDHVFAILRGFQVHC
jgi:hypothetical protein